MNEDLTGPERVREAVRRDRGGHLAPQQAVHICGEPDPNAMRADDPRWTTSSRPEPRHRIAELIADLLICPGCFGLRFGPAHLSRKLFGIDCQQGGAKTWR